MSSQNQALPKGKTPPADPADWTSYVDKVVSTFSAPPYNLTYFQVWNEAYWDTGFWFGGMDDYMSTMHRPAAEIIHRYGGKVVYGGWASIHAPQGLVDYLDSQDAWDTIDVIDMHYHSLADMDLLNRAGHNLPVWQTEFGYDTDFSLIPNFYPRAFYWALQNAGTIADFCKIFWFPWYATDSPSDPAYNRGLHGGSELTGHGRALGALGELLTGDSVGVFTDFTVDPAIGPDLDSSASSAEGFSTSAGTVLTLHLAERPSTVTVSRNDGSTPNATRVDILGGSQPLTWNSAGQVVVPVTDTDPDAAAINAAAAVATFYVRFD